MARYLSCFGRAEEWRKILALYVEEIAELLP